VDAVAVLAHVEAWIERHRSLFTGPGISLGLTDRDRTIGTLTLGEASRGVPLRPDHLFPIASVSKSFTAALVMREREAGRIDLHAPLQRYLPWFRPPSRFGPIAVHHLLSHTSGLASGQDATGEAVGELLALSEQEPGFAPGEYFAYSNSGYKALGLILEEVTGRPWWESASERILGPLGMHATEPTMTFDVRPRVAPGHASPFDDRPWHSSYGLVEAPWYESGTADGTICSNATDMCAYLRMLLARGGDVVSEESYGLMTSRYASDLEEGIEYGYGLWTRDVDGITHVGHSGSIHGYVAFLTLDPEAGFGAVVLSNGESGWRLRRDLLAFALASLRSAAYGHAPPAPPPAKTLESVEDAEAYAGNYGELRFAAEGDRLVMLAEGTRTPLETAGPDRFVAPLPAFARFPLSFERRDGDGVAVAHGPELFAREGLDATAPAGPDAAWEGLVGHYRAYGAFPLNVHVVLRRGRLRMIDPVERTDDDLVPLPAGGFRIGADTWAPGRVHFDTPIVARAMRAVIDGAPYFRRFGV
jgi:CubicO group peptidase (beta-lactamase class C family)